jgi:hypothetical protein
MNYLERVKEIKKSWATGCEKSELSEISPADRLSELTAPSNSTEEECEKSELSEISPAQAIAANTLLSRLQAGSQLLASQHDAWLEGKEDAASDERFSAALAAWDQMERLLRQVFGYEGCVFGPDRRCPEGATVVCGYCV